MIGFVLATSILLAKAEPIPNECLDWFGRAKIQPKSKNCEIDCALIPSTMLTFDCNRFCDALCSEKLESKDQPKLSSLILYPGLTQAEKAFVSQYPGQALKVFLQKERAEFSTDRNFPSGGVDDEADAFRHFVWAVLLKQSIGDELARKVLQAHEADPANNGPDRDMDEFNNKVGLEAADRLAKQGKTRLNDTESEVLRLLREKKLTVLRPGLRIPEKPK